MNAVQVITALVRPGQNYLVITVTSGHDYQPTRIIEFGDPSSKVTFDGVVVDLPTALAKLTKPHTVILHPDPTTYGVSRVAEFTATK